MGSHRVRQLCSGLACMYALEKEMATHSSVVAWRIPWTEEPGGLLSMGSQSRPRLKQLSSSSSRYQAKHFTRIMSFIRLDEESKRHEVT